jgi:hypothetical protein
MILSLSFCVFGDFDKHWNISLLRKIMDYLTYFRQLTIIADKKMLTTLFRKIRVKISIYAGSRGAIAN